MPFEARSAATSGPVVREGATPLVVRACACGVVATLDLNGPRTLRP